MSNVASRWQRIQPWVVCFSASLFFFYIFMQLNMFNALETAIIPAFHLTAEQYGYLSACQVYANILFLFPAGMLLDRFSTRKLLIVVMAGSVFCTYLFSHAQLYWQVEILRFSMGIFSAFALITPVRLATRWFPAKRMALVIGLIVTFAMIGGMTAQAPFMYLIDLFGWRQTLMIDALIGLFLLVPIVLFVRNQPRAGTQGVCYTDHPVSNLGLWKSLKKVLSNQQNWLAGIYGSLINLPLFVFGSTWGTMIIVQTHHLSRETASFAVSMIFIGMIFGSPAFGWLSDRLQKRKPPMIVGAITSLMIIIGLLFIPHLSFYALLITFFLLGFVCGSQIIAYPLIAESNPPEFTGTAEGVASVLIMSGGFTIQLFPILLGLNWNHTIINGIPVYSMHDYLIGLSVLPIAFVVALLVSFVVEETRCRRLEG